MSSPESGKVVEEYFGTGNIIAAIFEKNTTCHHLLSGHKKLHPSHVQIMLTLSENS